MVTDVIQQRNAKPPSAGTQRELMRGRFPARDADTTWPATLEGTQILERVTPSDAVAAARYELAAEWPFHLRREHERIHHAKYRGNHVLAA